MRVQDYAEQDNQFYPTPLKLAQYLKSLAPDNVKTVLDPSAGKGDILDAFSNYSVKKFAIEIDPNLRAILEGKKINVIGVDWLQYSGTDVFDAIIMNPPFKQAEKHFLKALDLAESTNTFIACVMNANTALNPSYAMSRAIKDYGLTVEYQQLAFSEAERKTDVEIAIVYGNMSASTSFDDLLDKLDVKEEIKEESIDTNEVDVHQKVDIHRLHQNYLRDVHNAKKLITMYNSFITRSGDIGLNLVVNGKDNDLLREAIQTLRDKYWSDLTRIESFAKHMTSKDTWALRDFLAEHKDIDFTIDNIYAVLQKLIKEATSNIEKTILDLFNAITNLHSYRGIEGGNVHLYDGWKTNQGVKVRERFIYPLARELRFDSMGFYYEIEDKLKDIELCFSYFAGNYEREFITRTHRDTYSYNVEKPYLENFDPCDRVFENDLFHIKFYLKGTAHIKVKDKDALRRFNIFCGERLNMLPPRYGRKPKEDMTTEEVRVAKEFDGNKYKFENRELLQIG